MLPHRERLLLPATFGICLALADRAATVAAPRLIPPPTTRNSVTTIGDIKIQSVGIKTNLRRGDRIVFTNVVVDTRNPQDPTQIHLTADEMTGRQTAGSKESGTVDMTGHIRYTIRQKTKQGTRILQGVAGHATYEQAMKRILLTAGVQATLTEEAKLETPATLRSASVTVLTDNSQRYELAGDPASNDIRFTPRRKGQAKGSDPAPDIPGTPIHLHGFRTGLITEGQNILASGPETTMDFNDPVADSVGRLVASQVSADFARGLSHARAGGSVRFHFDSPSRDADSDKAGDKKADKKPERQSIDGHSDAAAYDAEGHRLALTGNVEADLVDPATLLEPAHLTAAQVVRRTVEPAKGDEQQALRVIYEISGTPERSSLVFHPRPQEKQRTAAQQPVPGAPVPAPPKTDVMQSFALGTIHVTGFDHGSFEPGRDALLVGDRTVFHSEDKDARTSSTLSASRVTAKFAENRSLQQLAALGNVRFELKQPAEAKKGEGETTNGKTTASRLTTFNATATQATLTNTADGQILTAPGPWRTRETTDDPNKVAVSSGEKGDMLTYSLTTGELNAQSGNTPPTIVLETVNLNNQTAAAKRPAGTAPSATNRPDANGRASKKP